MSKEKIKRYVVGVALSLALCVLLVNTTTERARAGREEAVKQAEQEKPAEQVFKNIQVLKGLPASQLRPVMSFMASSLGVSCSYCHINPWDSDSKPTKQTARKMILMMRGINQENFGGRLVVNCATCHKGQATPLSVPPFASEKSPSTPKVESKEAKDSAPLPTVEQVFDNYVKALGGKAALDHLTTRVVKATESVTDGSTNTIEVYLKAPLKMVSITTPSAAPKNVYTQGVNGSVAWGQTNKGRVVQLEGTELAQATRDAEFYKGISYFKGEFSHITVKGREQIDGRDVYVIEGMNTEDFRERLYFDAKTWLLIRRYGEIRTAFGPLPLQADYEDYRDVDGVKLPFTVRWSLPDTGWTDKTTEIKHNVAIEDEKFNKPASK
jgi:hypothetical protein